MAPLLLLLCFADFARISPHPKSRCMAPWTPRKASPGGVSEVAELKAQIETLFQRFGTPSSEVRFEAGQLGPIGGEWARGPRAVPGRALLYFHGGFYLAGSPESHRGLTA